MMLLTPHALDVQMHVIVVGVSLINMFAYTDLLLCGGTVVISDVSRIFAKWWLFSILNFNQFNTQI